jgi:wyosine [tRNA(Phe)-imidazoG37] synthetase (radical SAM superfamily)
MSETYRYLFGPVPSRRLGRSLGIDLIPFKTCTMNCIYCQLGGTPQAAAERAEYVPVQEVLAELDDWAKANGQADHITLAGSGEPTLHTRFGEVLQWVKRHTGIPSVLLTNGSLLHLPEVRADAACADKVKVTLSAWDEASFQRIHRPAEGLTFEQLVEGERAFRCMFTGELSVEVFIVAGLNSDLVAARRIAAWVESIEPDRIDINTAVRPPAESGVTAPPPEQLQALAEIFGPNATVTAPQEQVESEKQVVSAPKLLGVIQRHPATAEQLAGEFSLSVEVIKSRLSALIEAKQLLTEERDGETYYVHRAAN